MISAFLLAAAMSPQEQRPANPPPGPVVVVRLEGQLAEWWTSLLRHAARRAEELAASAVVVELDTPGGEATLMKRLGEQISALGGQAETVTYVTHHALSAGTYLAMACDQIWMAPGSTLGAAMAIPMFPGGVLPQLDEDVEEKILSSFRAEFRSWAEQRHRNPVVAEAFVDNSIELRLISLHGQQEIVDGVRYAQLLEQGELPNTIKILCASGQLLALTPSEAMEVGYCDGEAADLDALLAARGWSERAQVRIEPTWSESLVGFIGSYAWLLLLGAAFFLVVSFNMPGLGAPELGVLVCLTLFLFHGYLVGLAEWTEVILVLGGLALLAVEIFVMPGAVVPGAAGALLLGFGLLMAMQDFVLPEDAIDARVFRGNLLILLTLTLVVPVVTMFAMRRFLGTRAGSFLASAPSADFAGSVAGREGAVDVAAVPPGSSGVALTPLRPAGRVEVAGQPYDAVSTGGFVEAGCPVRVLRRQGGSLIVAAGQPPAQREQSS